MVLSNKGLAQSLTTNRVPRPDNRFRKSRARCVIFLSQNEVAFWHGDQARERSENSLQFMIFKACTPHLVVANCSDASQS